MSWEFLLLVLSKFGFNNVFYSWIKNYVIKSYVQCSYQWGSYNYFKGGRGLKKGDPLSPFLFILAYEVLSKKSAGINHLESMVNFKGVSTLIHLIFVDDIFIFTRGTKKNLRNLTNFHSSYQNALS